jgi:sugar phosphate isomerase/epimerase
MAKEYFYGGSTYSFDPKYNLSNKSNTYGNFTGYRANFSTLGSAVDPRTANQIKEVSEHLNTGIKTIEVGALQPDVFQSIPKEHFKEINRMAKLAGKDVEVTFHAPMIDPTGIGERGWNRISQDAAEKELWDAIKKAQELNPKGTVVTFHATAGFPAPAEMKMKDENGKERTVAMTVINPMTGEVGQIGEKKKYFGSETGEPLQFDAQKELDTINEDHWMSTISNLNFASERAKGQLRHTTAQLQTNPFFTGDKEKIEKLKKEEPEMLADMEKNYKEELPELNHAKLFLREAYQNTKRLYDEVYSDATNEQKKALMEYAKKITPFINKDFYTLEEDPKKLQEFANIVEEGVKIISKIKPETYKPIKEFAIEKAAETTSNLAWKGYKEFEEKGKNAPILALENHPANQALLTTGEDLRKVVEESRKMFVKKAVENGVSEGDAEEQAKKLIGATWDVGHINMLRKYGYTTKDIEKQTEAVAPFIKKIHLADNFGLEHTEIPMGMGNVPMKEIMKKIEEGAEGYDIKKIIEAGNWWQHFSQNSKASGPLMPTLVGLGAPIFSQGYSGNVNWNQVYGGIGAGYFAGYGTMLPDQNFLTYGAGFTSLPSEMGGQISNKDSRMSGTPMA